MYIYVNSLSFWPKLSGSLLQNESRETDAKYSIN